MHTIIIIIFIIVFVIVIVLRYWFVENMAIIHLTRNPEWYAQNIHLFNLSNHNKTRMEFIIGIYREMGEGVTVK